MTEAEEGLYAELATTGSAAWARLHARRHVAAHRRRRRSPTAHVERLPMPAVRGLATHADPAVRRAAYDAEMRGWPTVAVAVRGGDERDQGRGQHRQPPAQLGRRRSTRRCSPTASAGRRSTRCRRAVDAALPDFRRWMRAKARLHGHDGGAAVVGPRRAAADRRRPTISWDDGLDHRPRRVRRLQPARSAGSSTAPSTSAGSTPGRATASAGGAFCMPFVDDRSLVLLNWSGSVDSAQTTAHELGHAYHNTPARRSARRCRRRLPMALAETASIFCETLVVEAGPAPASTGAERLALLDVDLQGANQVVVDIHCRFLFETERVRPPPAPHARRRPSSTR